MSAVLLALASLAAVAVTALVVRRLDNSRKDQP